MTYSKHLLNYLGPKLWNKLNSEAKNLPILNQFKNYIHKCDLYSSLADNNWKDCVLCNA